LTSPDTPSSSEDILFGREGGVATVVLNRPRALNAFTLGMYRRFDPMLRGIVKGYRLDAADAEDVVQTTWIRAYRNLGRREQRIVETP